MMKKVLILDLDDTIFPTRSMDGKIFKPFIDDLSLRLQQYFDHTTIDRIINDFWDRPADYVIEKYQIDYSQIKDSFEIFNDLDLELNIKPFSDYEIIKNMVIQKFLITNGILSLQKAKIKSLLIEKDFEEIIINDFTCNKKTKKDLFSELMIKYGLVPDLTYVVGDNPDSEIKAGNELNMITIQILRENITKGNNARYYIKTFKELINIIN